jgi:hypothetical protein
MVESTGGTLAPYFGHFLQWMYPLCTRPDSKKTLDAGGADVDNAISAVARMIKSSKDNVPLPQVIPALLAALPLQSDFSEGKNIFTCLMALLQAGDATALSLASQILVAFATAIVPDSKYDDETKVCVIEFFRSSLGMPQLQEAAARLPPEVQAVISGSLR